MFGFLIANASETETKTLKLTFNEKILEAPKQEVKQILIIPKITPVPPYDPRPDELERWFLKDFRCSRQVGFGKVYVQSADIAGIDYRLLPAISMQEQSCGSAKNGTNLWGWNSGKTQWGSIEEGISYVSQKLGQGALYKNKDTIGKLKTYNSVNKMYPYEVTKIMWGMSAEKDI